MSAIATPSVVSPSKKSTGTARKAKKTPSKMANSIALQAKELLKRKTKKIAPKKTTTKSKAPAPAEKREYGLDKATATELKKEKAYNAYREGSSYGTVVEALKTLGINRFHSADKLIGAYVAESDKAALKGFKTKEKRNDETGLDWKAKILQNAYVTTRADYGKRMRDIGWEVRCERDEKGQRFGLFNSIAK